MADEKTPKATLRTQSTDRINRMHFARRTGMTFPKADGSFGRDVFETLGYPRTLKPENYREEYERGGIAERLVEVMPQATWLGGAQVFENDDPRDVTEFEKAWTEMAERINLFSAFRRADILAGLGEFAVMVIGGPGEKLSEELTTAKPNQIVGLWPYSQEFAAFNKINNDTTNERFGMPETYKVRLGQGKTTTARGEQDIHWTRIVHVADGALSDEMIGKPRLRAVWNYLLDIQKIHGAGAEAFWRNAHQLNQLDLDPEVEMSPEEETALESEIEEVRHDMRDWIRTRGLKIIRHGNNTANFGQNIDALMSLTSGTSGIPKRLLLGSERGELASTQDRATFAKVISARRTGYGEPQFVRAWTDRMIAINALPTPSEYTVVWPEDNQTTEDERLEMAAVMADINKDAQSWVFTDSEIRSQVGLLPLDEDPAPIGDTDVTDDTDDDVDGDAVADDVEVNSLRSLSPEAVLDAADENSPAIEAAFTDWFSGARERLDLVELAGALHTGEGAARRVAESAVSITEPEMVSVVESVLAALVAGGSSAAEVATFAKFETSTEAVAAANAQAAQATASVHLSTMDAIDAALKSGSTSIPLTVRTIKDAIGLTAAQVEAMAALELELTTAEVGKVISRFPPQEGVRQVAGFRAKIPAGGATPDWIAARLARYEQMSRNWRAKNIARSVVMPAVSEGQRQLWLQAQARGDLKVNVRRQRVIQDDERTCPICVAGDGEQAKLNEAYADSGLVNPQMHMSCRCTEDLI